MEALFKLERGENPLLVSVPHAGTFVPPAIQGRFTAVAASLPDTDWFVDRLYDFTPRMGATLLVATHSRYVIDLNRPPDDQALYNSRTTGLVPCETFAGQAVYRPGKVPDAAEVERRLERYWRPYHEALAMELERIRGVHGFSVLLDAHSIRSELPLLFEGRLPHLNLGCHGGRSAGGELVEAAMAVLQQASAWSSVLDGRFRGGYITRHYGQPNRGVHALQLEIAQRAYMQESPPLAGQDPMRTMHGLLSALLRALADWRPGHGR